MTKHIVLILAASLLFSASAIAQTRHTGRVNRSKPAPANAANGLTRAKAAEMIIKSLQLPVEMFEEIWKRYPNGSRHADWGVCMTVTDKDFRNSRVKDPLERLQQWGMITIGEETTRDGACTYYWATIGLTDMGRMNLVREKDGVYYMKAYEISFGEVTGIRFFESSTFAAVEYTLKPIGHTLFGRDAPKQPWAATLQFALYDDGWRIKS